MAREPPPSQLLTPTRRISKGYRYAVIIRSGENNQSTFCFFINTVVISHYRFTVPRVQSQTRLLRFLETVLYGVLFFYLCI